MHNGCLMEGNFAFKVFKIRDIVEEQPIQMELFNEHRITKLAKESKLKNIIHLEKVYLAPDHIALKLRALECDLRYYLAFADNQSNSMLYL